MPRNRSEQLPTFPGIDPEIVEGLRLDTLGDGYAANAYFLSLKNCDARYAAIPLHKRCAIRAVFREYYAQKSK